MTPRLLRSDATAFDNLGFGALTHTISCIVKEQLGVAPTLEMSLLNDDPNFVNVEVGNIIAVEPNKNDPIQAFVIEEISKPIDGVVTIYATHIAQHRTKLIPVAPFTATDLDTALSLMVSSSLESNPFTLVRDEGKNNVVATMHPTVPHSFRELMGGVEGSILDTYRGEWKYDNFTLTLYNKRGRDNGVRVMYGRNMSDFKLEEQFNWDNSATGVIGYWVDSESGTTVIGDIQYSDYADLYPYKKTVCVDFSDKWESAPSVTDLNTYALSWINGKGLYGASVEVAFEHLNVEGGADIGLGDTVHIFNGTYNFEMESRIVGLEYDVLAEEYTSVTIGEQKTTLNEAIADIGGGATSSGGGGGASVDPSTTLPLMDGTAAVGTEQTYARGDHVHPTDTSRASQTDMTAVQTKTSRLSADGSSYNGYKLELNTSGDSTATGGYIDFHFNGSTDDYTSRIIEPYSGRINISAPNGLQLNGDDLIEQGSNANGHYAKFASGLMICWHTMSVRKAIETAWGVLYENSGGISWTYPQAFVSNPGFSVSRYGGTACMFEYSSTGDLTKSPLIYLVRPNKVAESGFVLSLTAIGLWK